MMHVKLDNVLMPEARKLTFQAKAQVLAAGVGGEPLYAAIERPEGKVVVLTVNLDQGDLPLRTAFPIMVTNALNWFAGQRGELRESQSAGAVTEVETPAGSPTTDLQLRSPDGKSRPLAVNGNKATVGPLDQCGIWSIRPAATSAKDQPGALVEIACNLANRRESDIRVPEGLSAKTSEQPYGGILGGRPIWFYLIALAWLLTGIEWYCYQRRWIT
jgi:hypothetical protein